jgi:hypothetical protein
MSDNSAQNNDNAMPNPRGFTVEEVPTPQTASQPVPQTFSQAPAHNPWEQNAPEAPTVVETVPQMSAPVEPQPNTPQAQEYNPTEPPIVEAPRAPVPETPPMSPPENSHHKGGMVKKLLFLIPAVLLVATIFVVAQLSGNNYTSRNPELIPTATPTETPATPVPTETPMPTKEYKNDDLLISMQIPDDYEVLSEDETSISLGRGGTELFVVRTDEFTNFDDEDETSETTVGGKEAVRLSLPDDGSIPIEIVQTIEESASAQDGPRYEFVMYVEDSELSAEFEKILNSVIFLVDTTDWETFENTTYNYMISYPPSWTAKTALTDKGEITSRSTISKDPDEKNFNNLVIQTDSNVDNAAFTAGEIVSSTRTLSGWIGKPSIELRKLGGGDAQIIQGELTGKWRVYVVIWYKNTVIQMTWDDEVEKGEQQVFDNILSSFEFTN